MGNTDAREARDTGIAQAAEHADAEVHRWTDRAYEALVAHANQHSFFTVEQVRKRVRGALPDAPTSRAWGAVVLRAARAGIIKCAGQVKAEDPKVHCNLVTLWRSLLRAPAAPAFEYATPIEVEVCALADRWTEEAKRLRGVNRPIAARDLEDNVYALRQAIARGRAAVTA